MAQQVILNGIAHDLDYEPSVQHGAKPMWRTPIEINGQMVHGVNINGYDYPPALDGAVLYMPGLPGYGSKIWDRSQGGNHGTIVGATWERLPSGLWTLRYWGDDYVNIDSALTSLAATTKGYWGIWVKLDDAIPAALSFVIAFGDTNANENLMLVIDTAGRVYAQARAAAVDKWFIRTDAAALANGIYCHLALVQDGISPILLINGVQVAQTFFASPDKTVWFSALTGLDNGRIGCGNYINLGNTYFLTNGNTALVKLINTNLTVAQIKAIVDMQRPFVS